VQLHLFDRFLRSKVTLGGDAENDATKTAVAQQLAPLKSAVHGFDASVSFKGLEDSVNALLSANKKETKQAALTTYSQRFRDLDNELTHKSS